MASTTPTLTGTERQVAWAEKIRGDIMTEVEPVFGRAAEHDPVAGEVLEWLRGQTEARWWIERCQGWRWQRTIQTEVQRRRAARA